MEDALALRCRIWRVSTVVAGLLGASSLMLACTSSTVSTVPTGAWAAEVAAAQKQANGDFQRQVLSDGTISREEYVEAAQRYTSCMREHGYRTEAVDDLQSGVFQFRTTQELGAEDIDDAIRDDCRATSLDVIEPLYTGMLTNPQKEDFDSMVLRCLQRKGIAPSELTLAEAKHYFWDASADPPWDREDDRVVRCSMNPTVG